MKKLTAFIAAVVLATVATYAVTIGDYNSLDKLIESADAIVILRVDKHITDFGSAGLYSTQDCYVYQTLKGDIPTNTIVRFQLMDTGSAFSPFVTPYAIYSTHLMFLTKKRTKNGPTNYRTMQIRGANVRVTPFGNEKMPDGKTVKDQIKALLRRTVKYNKKQYEKEQTFLNRMIEGTAEPTD